MNKIEKVYQELRKKYGKPLGQWRLWCKKNKTKREREEVIIEAILTQRTNWKNVEKAISNLKESKICSILNIYKTNAKKLSLLIKPAIFYKTKANYLKNLAEFIVKNYKNINNLKKEKLEILRKKLLSLKGIGPETADSILLYALDKPVFVIDEYTRRLVKRKNLSKNLSYSFLQRLFEKDLKKNFKLYQDFHALIVIEEKNLSKVGKNNLK